MLATLTSAALIGIAAEPVHVEVNANEPGEPRLIVIGLGDTAVKESRDRVTSALSNCGFGQVRTRTTINLAPGDLRKEGAHYDLPIALGLLASTGKVPPEKLGDYMIAGELSLAGMTRPVRGALAIAQLARRLGKKAVLLPPGCAEEASLVDDLPIYVVASLREACGFLNGVITLPQAIAPQELRETPSPARTGHDFRDLKGQKALRRAMEVAVAGSHNLLIIGPPGSGKSMAAKRIAGIMPPPTREESLEILCIHSVAGKTIQDKNWRRECRPFRSPHHTLSDVAMLGGGPIPGPGEISLAHHGVLFLDELPEFRRSVLQVLRQPLEDGEVTISRRAAKLSYPSEFMLVAAMNPCPCGYLGDTKRRCRCTPSQIEHYRSRVGGPLLDRIDLHVEAPAVSFAEMRSKTLGESSDAIRARVIACRDLQHARFKGSRTLVNARMLHSEIRSHCALSDDLSDMLEQAMERLTLSARALDRILKVSRTIADLAGSPAIEAPHLLEAIQYRALDRAHQP